MAEIKLFGKWSYADVNVGDISVQDFVAVKNRPAQVFVPHTAGRYQVKRFRKAQCPIVERLANALMRRGRNNGKKATAIKIIQQAFEIIHLTTGENPIEVCIRLYAHILRLVAYLSSPRTLQVLVRAVVNAGPREDSTRIGAGGIVRRQAVDVSPFRRINQAIYLIGIGSREAAFRTIKSASECLADEIINASKGVSNSYAIKKKDECERTGKYKLEMFVVVMYNLLIRSFLFAAKSNR